MSDQTKRRIEPFLDWLIKVLSDGYSVVDDDEGYIIGTFYGRGIFSSGYTIDDIKRLK